jgi:hypothetical protein
MDSNLGPTDAINKLNISQESSQLLSNVFAIQCRTVMRRVGVLRHQEMRRDLRETRQH